MPGDGEYFMIDGIPSGYGEGKWGSNTSSSDIYYRKGNQVHKISGNDLFQASPLNAYSQVVLKSGHNYYTHTLDEYEKLGMPKEVSDSAYKKAYDYAKALQDGKVNGMSLDKNTDIAKWAKDNAASTYFGFATQAFSDYLQSQGIPQAQIQLAGSFNSDGRNVDKLQRLLIEDSIKKAGGNFDPNKIRAYLPEALDAPELKSGGVKAGNVTDLAFSVNNSQQSGGHAGLGTETLTTPGAKDFKEAQASGAFWSDDPNYKGGNKEIATDFNQPADTNRPATEAEMANANAQQGVTVNQSTTESGDPQGYLPSYKGVFKGKENVLANDSQVNDLFKSYHGRDANIQELNYWRGKKLGDIETMFTQTTIFSGADADKIRAQMMAEGKTYIANQAELESLIKSGKLSADAISQSANSGSMMFSGTPSSSNNGGGTGTGTGTGTGATGTGDGASGTGTGTGGDGAGGDLIDTVVDAVGDVNASDTDILDALNNLKNGQIDPYYRQLIDQARQDVVRSVDRKMEDRIRELQTESFNLAENISNTQKTLEQSGLTFSGQAVKKLGVLAAFGQSTPAGLTPAQIGQNGNPVSGGDIIGGQTLGQTAVGLPTMSPAQMSLEGDVNMQNRLFAESSRSNFNRGLEDIGQNATRLLGSQGVAGMNLPSQATAGQPQTTGTLQYDYSNALQSAYGNLANSESALTDYQKLFL